METTQTKKPSLLLIILSAVILLGLVATGVYFFKMKKQNETVPAEATAETTTTTTPTTETAPMSESKLDLNVNDQGLSNATVTMETTKGTIQYKFYSKDAPLTTARLIELIQSGFYNGLTFHRVIPGFVAQGGDPQGTGMGGSGQKIKAEFNSRKHVLGTVAMARAGHDVNSQDSQFYICLGSIPHLDGQYTVYGQVVSGIEVVQKLVVGDKMTKVTVQ